MVVPHNKSNDRPFEIRRKRFDNRNYGFRILRCSREGCSFEEEISDNTDHGLPSNMVAKKFMQRGWEVGSSPKHDVCPNCVERERAARRARRNNSQHNVIQMAESVFKPKEQASMTAPPKIVPEIMKVMSREDKRLVNMKLHEVYIDEKSGYGDGWSDKRVANDLGVPVGWVSSVRDELFGPARDNEEIRNVLVQIRTVTEEARTLLADASKFQVTQRDVISASNNLNIKVSALSRTLDGLLAIATRLEKAVSP